MRVTVTEHPLIADRLTRMRERQTDRPAFRRALTELSGFLVYEATREHTITPLEIDTPMGPAVGAHFVDVPILVPVMRAGLGMLNAALDLLPDARTGFVGMKRDEETLLPHAYVNTVPDELGGRDVFVLDPMLATGGSAIQTCAEIRRAGAGQITLICVLAAPEGVEALRESDTADALVTGAIDERLNDSGFILPGLGDAGDRQFGLN